MTWIIMLIIRVTKIGCMVETDGDRRHHRETMIGGMIGTNGDGRRHSGR